MAAEETIDTSKATFASSKHTYSQTSCTVVQSQGNSTSAVNSSYPNRWYKGHDITFTPKSGYTITKIVLTGSEAKYDGQNMSASTGSISQNSSTFTTTWTGSISSSSSLTLRMGEQFRFGSVTITYTAASATHTVTIQSSNVSYGTVSRPSITNVANNATISTNGNQLTVGSTPVTATPAEKDANYSYSFNNWSGIPSGNKVTANCTITANFTRTERALINYRTSCSSAATLVSIAVSGQTTTYNVGDSFSFDGTCTATYSDASTKTVNPTNVSVPDMTTAGQKTITVTYTEGETTVNTTYDITVNAKKLATPSNLQVTNISCTEVTLSWDAVTNIKNYKLTYTDGVSTEEVTTGSESVTLNNLLSGTTYTWEIQAIGDGTNYTNSEIATGTFTTTSTIWKLITDKSQLSAGDKIIIAATDYNYALSTNQKTDNRGHAAIVKKYNTITFGADVQILTIEAGETASTYAFNTGSGYLYAASSSANQLKTQANKGGNANWSLSIDGNCVATIVATGTSTHNVLSYNSGSSLFACYLPTGVQKIISIYKEYCVDNETYKVTSTLTNATAANGNPTTVSATATSLTLNYTANTSYLLPEAITVKMGGATLVSGTDYTWNKVSGQLNITVDGFYGDIDIKIVAEEDPCYGFEMSTVTATSTSNSITLSWTTVEGATGYNVKLNGGDFTAATGTSHTFEGLTPNKEYTWEVQAVKGTCKASKTGSTTTQKETFTINWVANGQIHFSQSDVEGTTLAMPSAPADGSYSCDDKVFVGWTETEISGTTDDEPSDLFTSKSGTLTANKTYYAVFATADGDGGSVGETTTVAFGDQVVIIQIDDEKTELTGFRSDKAITDANNYGTYAAYSTTPAGTLVWTVEEGANTGTLAFKNGNYYLNLGDNDNHLSCSATKNANSSWTVTESDDRAVVTNVQYDSRKIMWNQSSTRFACYNKNHGQNSSQYYYHIKFYKLNGGTTYSDYTTSPACDPMITIGSTEPVMVTSAKDIRVDAVQNITISATNLDQNADKAQVSIKIVSENSAFKFKEVDANGDGQATSTWTGIANATFDKTLCVTYTPTVSGREETATLTVTAYRHNGSTEYATATMQVRGRSLPEQFVLVANTGDGWVALPNTLGTGSTASIPYPIAVEVDNDADPTSIPLAPSTTIYKAAARSTVNAIPTGLRFTTEAGGYLQASTSETNIWLSSNNSENMQSWTLNSTDFVDYSIRVNNAAEGHYLNYNNTQKKIGNYKSDNKLRILPVGAVCEQHAAPEDIEASSVRATSATIQWSAVSTATAGYEYRIGATGEWTKIGNVTELEITGLDPLTNYVVYVRASVEGAIINCSNEAEVSFTTVNCDDVPTNITYTSSSQSITVSWEAKAATSIVKLYSDKEGTTEVKSIESSSPCTLSDLEKYTTYYVQILAGGNCPSQIIEVSTLIPNINIAEWMTDGILVDVDTDEDVSVIIENEESYGSGSGQVAEELFFSKYFEGSGSLKLLAIYNGTGKDVDLSIYRIERGSNGDATNISKTYDLSQLGVIKQGQEIIFYSWPLTSEYSYSCSQSFLDSKVQESGLDANPRWILCDAKTHNGIEFEAMDFSGNDPLLLYKSSELIDVFGVSTEQESPASTQICSGRSDQAWSADGVTNMDYGKTTEDFPNGEIPHGVNVDDETITAYTARVIMFRKNTVVSGKNAVTKNTTTFATFAEEWEARQVCMSGDDGDLTCAAYKELGKFNYSEYYTKYESVGEEQVFPGENRTDGTVKITIEGLPNYSCHNIKLNLKIGEDLKLTEITKVPILISDEQTTKITSSTFTTLKSTLGVIDPETKEKTDLTDEQLIEKCETCDIVVLANGKLTHETDGIDQFRDLTIYPEGVFHNTSVFNVNRLLIHAKKDNVGYAIIEKEGVSITTDAIAHTKRIDAQYWYPFSLPYNCNIADITQANGEPLGDYGVHWGIQYYDGKKRQESGTSAGIGQSSNFWTPIYNSNEQLKAYQGYMIALFDASVNSQTEMRTIYFPPVSEQMYTESGTDSKETTITSWNVNLEAEKRHHGWNFTGSPYISVFNPQATGLSEDRGLFSEVLIVSGHYDQGSNEYLYDDEYVYVSIPSPNGAKYYDQYITSATSLKPFTAYFVQAIDPTSGNDETQTLAYAKAGRELPTSAPRRSTSTRQRVLVELGVTAPDGQTDNTGVWVDECYTPTYEIAADLTKMYVADAKPQLYTLDSNNEKMAYNAIPDASAENIPLGLYAPVGGNYTLALNNRVSRLQGAETVELLYNDNVVANLFYEDYVISSDKGIVNGYSLRIRRRTLVDSAIDNITGQVMHIMNENGILTIEGIATDAQVSVYDMLGRLVAVQSADGKTNISMPIMTQGVYNVVVGNDYGKTTVKVVLK